MACLPGSRKGASNMGDTSSVLQAKFFSMQMNLQGRGVHLRHSASFIFAVRGSSKVHELAKGMYVWSRQVPIASQLFHFNLLPSQNQIPGKKPWLLQQRAMVGPPQGDVNHPIRPKGDTWFYWRVEVSFSGVGSLETIKSPTSTALIPSVLQKPSSLLAGAHGVLSDPPQKGIALFS